MIHDNQQIEKNGRIYRVNIKFDGDTGKPWEESEGHGIVRESKCRHWVSGNSNKAPGEWPMNRPGRNQYQYYYDYQGTIKKATAENWGLNPDALAKFEKILGRKATKKEVICESVRLDYAYLSNWINDIWAWCGLIVTDNPDAENDYSNALWGIADNDHAGINEIMGDLISEAEARFFDAEIHRAGDFAHIINCGI